jgi:hypothetical protein
MAREWPPIPSRRSHPADIMHKTHARHIVADHGATAMELGSGRGSRPQPLGKPGRGRGGREGREDAREEFLPPSPGADGGCRSGATVDSVVILGIEREV